MSTNYNPKIVTDGLVLCLDAANVKSYPGTGTVWSDLSGNGNNGTLTNGPVYNSSNGGCIVFDGVNDGILLPGTNLSLNTMTIEAWCYAANFQQNGFIFEKTTNGAVNTQYSFFFNAAATHLYYRTYGLSTRDLTITRAASGVVDAAWNHMVATFDGTYKKIYVNSVLKATSGALTGTVTQNTTGAAFMGIYGNFVGYPFNGKIAGEKIYNRALSATEIKQNFNATRSRYNI